jgi:hypothetical protein
MRRRALLVYGAVVLVGIGALAAVAESEHRSQAFTLGVVPSGPVVSLAQDRELCQRPIDVTEEFSAVTVQLNTRGRPGSPYVLEVREENGKTLTRRRVQRGYPDGAVQTVTLPRSVAAGRRISVCVRNAGESPIAPYGNLDTANPTSSAYLDGRRIPNDVTLVFLRREAATTMSLVPSIVERASLFHGAWGSSAAYWVLLAALVLGPALFAAEAVGRAFDSRD